MAQILDIFGRDFIGFVGHVHSLPGLLCCCGASGTGTTAFITPKPTTYPTRSWQTGKDGKLLGTGQIPVFPLSRIFLRFQGSVTFSPSPYDKGLARCCDCLGISG